MAAKCKQESAHPFDLPMIDLRVSVWLGAGTEQHAVPANDSDRRHNSNNNKTSTLTLSLSTKRMEKRMKWHMQ